MDNSKLSYEGSIPSSRTTKLIIGLIIAGYKNHLIDDKIALLNEEFKNGKILIRDLVNKEQHLLHNKEGNVGLAIVAAIGIPFCIFNIKFVLGLLLVIFTISIFCIYFVSFL